MRIRPLRGQCLVEMLPPDEVSAGGVFLPEEARQSPATELSRAKRVTPRGPPVRALVCEIGPWRVAKRGPKKGFQIPPEFKLGDTVIVHPTAGQPLQWANGRPLKLVRQEQVLAVVG